MRNLNRIPLAAGKTILLLGLALLHTSVAEACSTPVYRYAMYNWAPAPYFFFHFHYGTPPKQDEAVNGLIEDLAETGPAMANLIVEEVDLSLEQFDRLPTPVKESWLSYLRTDSVRGEPAYAVFTSWGAELHRGRLDAATVRAMVESPARAKIGKLLQTGSLVVILLVPGSDEAANKRAEQVVQEVISQAASGAIAIESAVDPWLPPPGGPGEPSEEQDRGPKNEFKIGLIKVGRSEAAEKWLVGSLMKMEPDLEGLSDEPMVFFFYGRGRAMLPYVGKGITLDNLAMEVQFLAGPCSCQVKEQNPGVEMLMRWDWDATAEAMAATDPAFYGGPYGYQEFSPEEGNSAASEEAEADLVGGPAGSASPEAEVQIASVAPGSEPPSEESVFPGAQARQATGPSQPDSQQEQTAGADRLNKQTSEQGRGPLALAKRQETPVQSREEVVTGGTEQPQRDSFVRRQLWTLGIGFGLAIALVVTAGFVLTRKRGASGGR